MTHRKAFTLIELLVAVGLMVILSGSIIYIFQGSRRAFRDGRQSVFILQNIRNAIEVMQKDFDTIKLTHDMEFWEDAGQPPNGHFDPTERVVPNQFDFPNQPRIFRGYNCAMTIIGASYKDPKYERDEQLRSDAVYFRGASMIDKALRDCLIVYMIEVPEDEIPDVNSLDPRFPEHSTLRKYTVYKDQTGLYQIKVEDLCSYVQSFKVEYWFDDPCDGEARIWWGPKAGSIKEFAYQGAAEITQSGMFKVLASGFQPSSAPPPNGAAVDKFSQIGEGDHVFLFHDATDEWSTGYNKDYVIDRIERDKNAPVLITFKSDDVPPENIQNVRFRAGYLPPAIRITLQITDEKRRLMRTFRPVFRLKGR